MTALRWDNWSRPAPALSRHADATPEDIHGPAPEPLGWRTRRPVPPPCRDCSLHTDHYEWCPQVGGLGYERRFDAPLGGAA